jgi:hypothetical protein
VHDQRVRLGLFGLAGNPSKRNTSENVHETGVSPSGQSGFPVVAAEAEQGSELEERPGHGPDRSFCALQVEGQDPDAPHDARRRYYRLTEAGRRAAEDEAELLRRLTRAASDAGLAMSRRRA